MHSSHSLPAERVVRPPRQAGVVEVNHKRYLAAVGLIVDVIDGLCKCDRRGCSSSLAAHGSLHHLRPCAVLTWNALVRAADKSQPSARAVGSRSRRDPERAVPIAVAGLLQWC